MTLSEIKLDIIKHCQKLKESGLVAGTWGNISVKHDNKIVITPSGVDYTKLIEEDIVVCDLDGNVIEGKRNPSSELSTHMAIYKKRSDISAVIHTHSIYATAISTTRKNIPAIVEDMAMVIGGEVSCSKYALPGTPELANNVIEVIGDKYAVLMANHGAVGIGRSLSEAFLVCEILEKSAKIYLLGTQIGKPIPISAEDVQMLRDVYINKYSKQ